jgi:hypothetical protein
MLRQLLVLWAGIILLLIGGSSSFGQTNPSESQVVPDAGYTLTLHKNCLSRECLKDLQDAVFEVLSGAKR